MMAKRLQLILVVTLALSMVVLFVQPTNAQTAIGVDQDVVRVLEGNWQALPQGAQHWYRFDYAGEQLPIRISLDVNSAQSAEFRVWTAAQFAQLAIDSSAAPAAASTLDPNDATHIVWEGTLAQSGTYYIVVQPATGANAEYLLTIGGRGLAPAADGGAIVSGALNVNVRSGPSTAYSVIRTIPQGTQLTVLGQDASGTWLAVQLPDGSEGWVARFLTGFTGTADIVAAPDIAQPLLAPPATTAPAATAPVVPAPVAQVNIRSGPATSYAVIATVATGAQFTVLGQDASGQWLGVRFADGTEGWIARFLTDFAGTAAVVATSTATQPPLAPPATVDTGAVFVSGALNVNLRSGPSTLYTVIRTMAQGTQMTVLGQDSSSGWLYVRLSDGAEGWIARFLTNFSGTVAVMAAPALVQPVFVQPPLAPPATVPVVTAPAPAMTALPSQPAAIDNFPIEQSLDNNWRILNDGATQWFSFSHSGDAQPVQIWMNVDPDGAGEFRIYSEEDAQAIMAGANPDDFADIGRGTNNPNEPADLFWRGAFEEHGRYFVMVRSGSTSDVRYSIYGVGPSIGG